MTARAHLAAVGKAKVGVDRIAVDAVECVERGLDRADVGRILRGQRQSGIGGGGPDEQPAGTGKHLVGEQRGLRAGEARAENVPASGPPLMMIGMSVCVENTGTPNRLTLTTLAPAAVERGGDDPVRRDRPLIDVDADRAVVQRQAAEREDVAGGAVDHGDGRVGHGGGTGQVGDAVDEQRRAVGEAERGDAYCAAAEAKRRIVDSEAVEAGKPQRLGSTGGKIGVGDGANGIDAADQRAVAQIDRVWRDRIVDHQRRAGDAGNVAADGAAAQDDRFGIDVAGNRATKDAYAIDAVIASDVGADRAAADGQHIVAVAAADRAGERPARHEEPVVAIFEADRSPVRSPRRVEYLPTPKSQRRRSGCRRTANRRSDRRSPRKSCRRRDRIPSR